MEVVMWLVCFFFLQVRLPSDVTDEVDEDPSGSKAIWERGLLSGASQKVCACEYACVL